ncbi:MAG: NAD-binding protein [Candidatus Sericytochromatia bacterium]|nr:NAD-binding protein [Candidatus Sericytochromatia bacterium]
MILIIGCGRLGGSLAARLAAAGKEVVVLDHERRNLDTNLPRAFPGQTVEGLEIDSAVLRRAGIERAEAVAAVARDESTNMMAADVARQIFRVPRVVVRIDEPRMAALYMANGFEVISPMVEGTLALERALAKGERVS